MDYFKEVNEGKTFTFPHCWKELRGSPKFEEGFESYMASLMGSKTAKDASVIDLDGGQPATSSTSRASRPRGHKATKADMKRDVATLHLVGTLKDLYAEKEMSNGMRGNVGTRKTP